MNHKIIYSGNAPKPGGHYSQAIVHNNLVYVSGQLAIDAVSGEKLVDKDIKEQTLKCLNNLEQILISAGSNKEKLIKSTVFISKIEYWPEVNQVFIQFFGDHKPARSIVPVNDLHYGLKIEIEAIAYI